MATTGENVYPYRMKDLLYLDRHLLVIAKDPGDAVESARKGTSTVVQWWRNTLDDRRIQPIHRIDQPVGGIVVLGRTKEAIASLNEQFSLGTVERNYVAVVTTPPDPPAGVLEDRVLQDPTGNRSRIVAGSGEESGGPAESERGRVARLTYTTVGNTTHHTVLEVTLHTGRHHQIRVQLAHRGWHILGDTRYGARRPMKDKSIGLWARRISFVHPFTGERLTLYAPAPNGSVWNVVVDLPLSGFPGGKE